MSFLVDAFYTATNLINMLPTLVLNGMSPVEKLFGQSPDYKVLRVFGYLCYSLLCPYNQHKVQFRLTPSIFLGYAPNR